ncbi:VTT domain-containing protein [Silvimonas sp.]|uniref:VTT domain-containing protein n=1 Tax=Silvimonas sp. TaxID=2650811 RepID=UPI00284E0455|nr:VTT domain-containing protein [Silvimonas sp.]MDR3426521.1 VTT domain-containing protein [Silvimonas sp.]
MDWTQLLQLSLHFDQHLGGLIAQYGTTVYVMLFAIVFCEIAFLPLFFLPGDPLLFICGAFCARGAIDIWVLIPLLFVATVAGSVVNYWIARGIGQRVLAREHRWLDRNALQKTHAFYEQRGGMTFLLSPFIAVIRTLAPFVGGLSAMTFARFLWFVTLGAALWVGVLVVGGYFFGNVPLIRDHMSSIVLLGVALGVGALVVSSVWRLIKGRRAIR